MELSPLTRRRAASPRTRVLRTERAGGGIERHWHSAAVPPELVRRWTREWPSWFGPGRRDVPGAAGQAWIARVETELGSLVAKRERTDGWKSSLARFGARELRSVHAFHAGHELREHGLRTPEPLACLVRRDGPAPRAVLVTRQAEGASPWRFLVAGNGGLSEVLTALARSLAALHAAGFRHRDLKEPNLLLRRGTRGAIEVSWLDLVGLSRAGLLGGGSPPAPVRRRDLARLCVSFQTNAARAAGVRAGSWRRFVRAYLEAFHGRPPTADELSATNGATTRWAESHLLRNWAQGRPLT